MLQAPGGGQTPGFEGGYTQIKENQQVNLTVLEKYSGLFEIPEIEALHFRVSKKKTGCRQGLPAGATPAVFN